MQASLRCTVCLQDGVPPALAEYVINGWSCCPRHAEMAVKVYNDLIAAGAPDTRPL
jgi:hypothetical protein